VALIISDKKRPLPHAFAMTFFVSLMRTLSGVLALTLPWLNVSCSTQNEPDELVAAGLNGYWAGNTMQGAPKIVIDLTQQRLRYFKGDSLVGVARISSGRESHATRPGQFRILDKDRDLRSSLYGAFVTGTGDVVKADVDSRRDACPPGARFEGADMPYFMRIVGGIGMHAGYLPGYPSSHGCIRLPKRMAELFFEATPTGAPVEIIGQATAPTLPDTAPIVAPKPTKPARDQRKDIAQQESPEHRSFFRRLLPERNAATPPEPQPVPQLAAMKPATPSATKPAPLHPPTKTKPAEPADQPSFFQRLFSGQKSATAPPSKPSATRPQAKPVPKSSGSPPKPSSFKWNSKPPPGMTRYL